MQPLKEYFKEKDKDFIGVNKVEDEIFIYNASDVLVQSIWELPIVIQWPDSIVSYKFTSQHGDISFGIMFVAAPEEDDPEVEDLEVETVEDVNRVPSCSEPIEGSFQVPYEGVIFFLWDNNYDWSSIKKISYHIEVKQPSFTIPDETRSIECLNDMRLVTENLVVLYNKHADAESCLEHNIANVVFLEDQVKSLEMKLLTKSAELKALEVETVTLENTIQYHADAKLGVCIRSLDIYTLSVVFSFLPISLSYLTVCKHWKEILLQIHANPECLTAEKPLTTYTKFEIKQILQDIHLHGEKSQPNFQLPTESATTIESQTEGKPRSEINVLPGDVNNQIAVSDSSSVSDNSSLDDHMISTIGKLKQSSPHSQIISGSKSQIKVSVDHLLPNMVNPQSLLVKTKQQDDSDRVSRRRNFKSYSQYKANVSKTHQGEPNNNANVLLETQNDVKNSKLKKKDLLQQVQKIRSEQQLDSLLEYLNAGFNKIDQLNLEKRRIKKLIRAWNATYLKQHDKLPTSAERKGHVRELHEEYQQVSLALKIRKEKMNDALKKVGLTKEEFEDIRSNKFINW